ncbi:MAG: Dabb family protein [Lachnospiraceae bacterium]|nr:Dabb family protein [Lachnospiraceae bacterium]
MVKHVILWTLRDRYSGAEIEEIKKGIKKGLEGLKGQIPGLLDIKVITKPLVSSNCDVMLDASFENEAALNAYSIHPAHVTVANEQVRPFTASRICMDYEVE